MVRWETWTHIQTGEIVRVGFDDNDDICLIDRNENNLPIMMRVDVLKREYAKMSTYIYQVVVKDSNRLVLVSRSFNTLLEAGECFENLSKKIEEELTLELSVITDFTEKDVILRK